MKRREFIKKAAIASGAIVAAPLLVSSAIAETKPLMISGTFDHMTKYELTIFIKEKIRHISHRYLFELNDDLTRNSLRAEIAHYLDYVVAADSWLADYAVICDETNNTPKRIENGNLYGDVMLKFHSELSGFTHVPFTVKLG